MIVHIQTLGCKVNQYETQALGTLLEERGHELSSSGTGADVCVVNTCAVTAESGRKSRQAVRHLKKQNPAAVIAVCGCFSQVSPEEIEQLGVDIISGSGDRHGFVESLERAYSERRHIVTIDEALKRREFELLPSGGSGGRTRAMLKIQDGCSNFCTYCVIPYARGPVRSISLADAIRETHKLKEQGYREIVITGIEIASYGHEFKDGTSLQDVVKAISDCAGSDVRLRLGSLEPRIITEEFCKTISACGNVCDHFHLSLQSGSAGVLERMHRKYSPERFYESVVLLRRYFPNCAITTDLITGFPGETDAEHAETLEFIEKCAFSAMHIFPYSQRPNTPAAAMPNQIEKSLKQLRAKQAAEIAARLERDFLEAQVGKTLSVLLERKKGGVLRGHSENYLEVAVPDAAERNTVLNVQINFVRDGILWGNIHCN